MTWSTSANAWAMAAATAGCSSSFENIQAGDDLDKHLKQEFHRELMEQAMGLVQSRVAARTWDAFRLTVLEECSGATAAARLEMTIARVYTSKSQVKRLIREEVRKLAKIR